MKPFAGIDDLISRFRPVSPTESARAEVLLADASERLVALCENRGIDVMDNDRLLPRLKDVVCAAVIRVLKVPVDQPALNSYQQSAGGFAESMTYANPSGDMHFTKAEKEFLGITRKMRVGSITPEIRSKR
jgi:hypothetical protein